METGGTEAVGGQRTVSAQSIERADVTGRAGSTIVELRRREQREGFQP